MSQPVSHTGAEIHAFHPVRWMATGFFTTMLLVALFMILPAATVIVAILAVLFTWAEVAR